jgi:FkbM family methyltransferase
VLWLEEAYFRRKGEKELFLVEYLCRPQQDAIDVGGNIGCYSLFMRKYASRVYSFEPVPWMAEELVRKFGDSVIVRQIALSSSAGTAQLHIPMVGDRLVTAMSSLSAAKSSSGQDITIQAERLDEVYEGQVGLIKIDVEGHEEAVLEGARRTITRCRPRLLIEIEDRHAPGARERIVAFFESLDYSAYFFQGGTMQDIANFDPGTMQDLSNTNKTMYINNFIFIPNEDVFSVMNNIKKLKVL